MIFRLAYLARMDNLLEEVQNDAVSGGSTGTADAASDASGITTATPDGPGFTSSSASNAAGIGARANPAAFSAPGA